MPTYHIRPADPDGCAVGCAVVILIVAVVLALFVIALSKI